VTPQASCLPFRHPQSLAPNPQSLSRVQHRDPRPFFAPTPRPITCLEIWTYGWYSERNFTYLTRRMFNGPPPVFLLTLALPTPSVPTCHDCNSHFYVPSRNHPLTPTSFRSRPAQPRPPPSLAPHPFQPRLTQPQLAPTATPSCATTTATLQLHPRHPPLPLRTLRTLHTLHTLHTLPRSTPFTLFSRSYPSHAVTRPLHSLIHHTSHLLAIASRPGSTGTASLQCAPKSLIPSTLNFLSVARNLLLGAGVSTASGC
jgi:hypothetical protein